MTYDRRKRFVLNHLPDNGYRSGLSIIESSSGLLRKGTAYQTFDRMQSEKLIKGKGNGRAWERKYRRSKPWDK